MKDIVIVGAGGLGREILGLIQSINKKEDRWRVKGFYDDTEERGSYIHHLPVLGTVEDLNSRKETLDVVIAIGDSNTRKWIYERLNNRLLTFPSLISPNANLLDQESISIEEGVICCAGCILTCDITVGAFSLLNLACTVGHDAKIGPFGSFMPSVNISGETRIGAQVYMGTNSTIINQVTIGNNTTVGAGAIVTKDLPANCVAIGCPAQPIRFKL
ncbi:acetyltransferase [Porphyromonas sp.]